MNAKRTATATKWANDNDDEHIHDAEDRKSKEIRNRRLAKKLATKQTPQGDHVVSDEQQEQSQHQEIDQQQQLRHTLRSSPFFSTPCVGPPIQSCRSVDCYEKLNRIEEGSYGIVYRARDKQTGEIVALKKLKLENEKNGFPITTLREIHTLLLAKHPNIVDVREIVVTPSYSG
ncbi:hypothetical protein HK100_010193, partial [Physocladia obscura]